MNYSRMNMNSLDSNNNRYAGWTPASSTECYKKFFSNNTIQLISKKVTELTLGVDEMNRKIIVPNERILEVMDDVYSTYTPTNIGDIHTRYNIPNYAQSNVVQDMIDQTIEVITSNIRNSLGMEQYNKTLTKWTTLMGDFNKHGLRQHSIIKVREKRPMPMMFNMNY